VNYRPEYSHHWNNKSYYTEMRLDPLGQESAAQMLAALLATARTLLPLKRIIIERTEGTPFFMEEIVQPSSKMECSSATGRWKLRAVAERGEGPRTVQAVLASRIDRLPARKRELLQTLGRAGREFPLGLVHG